LDISSIESLLDQETWEKADKEQLLKIRAAKMQGRTIDFQKGGLLEDDTLGYGKEGSAKSPTLTPAEKIAQVKEKSEQRINPKTGKPYPKKTVDPTTQVAKMEARMNQRGEDLKSLGHLQDPNSSVRVTPEIMAQLQEIDKLRGTGELTEAQQDWQNLQQPLTQEQQVAISPDKNKADNMASAATEEGSIFTHDTNLEKTLWDIWAEQKPFFNITSEGTVGIEGEKPLPLTEGGSTNDFAPQMNMFGNQQELMAPVPVIDVSPNAPLMGANSEMIPSQMLEQTLITKMMEVQKQADTGSGGGNQQMLNMPTNIDQSNTQIIQSPSSAHAAAVPAGTGRG
jgi:hypothetical protein